ncbi:hypothetical protein ACIQJ8_31905 [Streptomyces globisporus]|uniref:hypothetical protein n=1 Tax=Streptomyces globisporus TaxID=1908 RepID=UPI0037A2ACB4
MSNAAEILESYARDWEIQQTPSIADGYLATESRGLLPAIAAVATVRENLAKILDVVPSLQQNGVPSLLDAIRGPFTGACRLSPQVDSRVELWTRAAKESDAKLRRELLRSARDLVSESTRPESRADRALKAVSELAHWLRVTDGMAAEVAGGYRRSYYNWVNGVQPYGATTLNLFEAHAFVASLVDSLGERGAREWLALEINERPRLSYLRDRAGRAELSRLASRVLFKAADQAPWQPEEELRHKEPGESPVKRPKAQRARAQALAPAPKRTRPKT